MVEGIAIADKSRSGREGTPRTRLLEPPTGSAVGVVGVVGVVVGVVGSVVGDTGNVVGDAGSGVGDTGDFPLVAEGAREVARDSVLAAYAGDVCITYEGDVCAAYECDVCASAVLEFEDAPTRTRMPPAPLREPPAGILGLLSSAL